MKSSKKSKKIVM